MEREGRDESSCAERRKEGLMEIINNNGENKTLLVKFFCGYSEEKINKWLKENINIRIITILQSQENIGDSHITIWYFEN